ncbi:MAG: polyprenyl diphosphate synthase, partial [Bacteroidales bacterium]|nr:polyprenyl diphosphate synthase [Bacteroidales bacterium]
MQSPSKVPTHVSIIMDGNGRWAKERGKERAYGHFEGVESVRAVTEASVEWGVKYLSVFAFSEENWGRPEAEVSTLMKLMFDSMMNELPTFLNNGVKFRVLGNRERLSKSLNEAIDAIEQKTAGGGNLTLILFLSYSGKWDVFQAAKQMAYDLTAN